MLNLFRGLSFIFLSVGLASQSLAGMKQDLADCNTSHPAHGAAACTRVMKSGRLPRPQFYIGYFNRAGAYRKAGKNKRALADLNRSVKLRPRFAKAYYARALTRHDLGDLDGALADMDRYIELKPKSPLGYYKRALLHRKLKDLDRTLADLDKALELKTDFSEARALRDTVVEERGPTGCQRYLPVADMTLAVECYD